MGAGSYASCPTPSPPWPHCEKAQRPRAPRWASASGGRWKDCRRVAARSSCSGSPLTAVSGTTSGPTPSPRRPAPWTRPPQLWTLGPRTGRQPDWRAPVPSRPGRPGGTACLWARASPARRRRRQAGRGRRPPVESRPLDHLYPVATQGPAGALPAVQAVRQPAVQRGPLPSMPGGSRHSEARDPTLPGPHEHPVQTAGMPLPPKWRTCGAQTSWRPWGPHTGTSWAVRLRHNWRRRRQPRLLQGGGNDNNNNKLPDGGRRLLPRRWRLTTAGCWPRCWRSLGRLWSSPAGPPGLICQMLVPGVRHLRVGDHLVVSSARCWSPVIVNCGTTWSA